MIHLPNIRSQFSRELLVFAGCIWAIAIFSLCQSEWSRLHMGLTVDWFAMSFYFFVPAALWTATFPLVRKIHHRFSLRSSRIRNWLIHAGVGVVLAVAIKILALLIDFELRGMIIKPMNGSFFDFLNSIRYLLISSTVDNAVIYWIVVLVMRFNSREQPTTNEGPAEIALVEVDKRIEINGIPAADIHVIEAFGNYLKIHSSLPVVCVRGTLKSMMAVLDSQNFIRVHRSFIVNKTSVKSFAPGRSARIEMKNGQRITVSSGYRQRVTQMLSSNRG